MTKNYRKKTSITWIFFNVAIILIRVPLYLLGISNTGLKRFFKVIAVDDSLGKVKNYVRRAEFKVGGSMWYILFCGSIMHQF